MRQYAVLARWHCCLKIWTLSARGRSAGGGSVLSICLCITIIGKRSPRHARLGLHKVGPVTRLGLHKVGPRRPPPAGLESCVLDDCQMCTRRLQEGSPARGDEGSVACFATPVPRCTLQAVPCASSVFVQTRRRSKRRRRPLKRHLNQTAPEGGPSSGT